MEELQGLVNGDADIVKGIYNEHFYKIKNLIQKQGGSISDAEDIFQNALEATITRYVKKPFVIEISFGAYLYKTCTYMWYRHQKDKKRDNEVRNTLATTHSTEDNQIQDSEMELELILTRTMKMLSSLCQQLIQMLKSGESTERILEALDFPRANTMYRRKHACMKSWRKIMVADPQYLTWKRDNE
jgi:DNA-directed RNA polymerase specialized sigma24 family protein